MTARGNILNGVTFETPNKDFTSHIGMWFQYDSVWWSQSNRLKPASQIGDLEDGTFFRRIRPYWEGTAYENMEWFLMLGLDAVNNDVPDVDEMWAGFKNLPIIGSVRIGKMRVPQGLEAATTVSARAQTFMEQSSFNDAFYEDEGVGLWTGNSVLNQRLTWAGMLYRQDNDNGLSYSGQNGADFGDGKYAFSGGVTGLPIYENDGRCLLHLGASATWRKAEDLPSTANPPAQGATGGPGEPTFIDFRARPQMRDGTGDYGSVAGLPGNQKRLVDTGALNASSATVIGTEFLYIRGPFSVQAEYAWAAANDVVIPNPSPKGPKTLGLGDVWFNGGYIQLSYFLTGENRRYDRRLGRLDPYYVTPYTPFYFTRGEDGHWLFGRGAWEVAARWNHLNLDNGLIQAGQTDALEVGLNWYLNTNLKIQFEYLHQNRYDKSTGPNGTLPGDVDALGIRTQFFF